jgi:small subunit ribosomal protein S16
MAVCIRLARYGRLHRPFFRVVAIDGRCHREGVANEILGTYDPLASDKNLSVNGERIKAWVAQGAQVSEALTSLLKHYGYEVPVQGAGARRASAKKVESRPTQDGKKFVPASRRSRIKHLKAKKAAAKAAAAAAAPAAETAPA